LILKVAVARGQACNAIDPNCFTPNSAFISRQFEENTHIIKVQFHAINFHTNLWERVVGSSVDNEPLSKSSIDVVIFDVDPTSKLKRKHGTATFDNESTKIISFDSNMLNSNYSIQLSANKNISKWYSGKTTSGFVINTPSNFTGEIDWTVINLN